MQDLNTKYNPYCPICEGCGEDLCCSPLNCKQTPEGHYCEKYLLDLKFGYAMDKFFQENIWHKMSDDLKEEYDKIWGEKYDHYYPSKTKEL